MPTRFFYDTHYQVDKPLALLHVTLATASPAKSVPDDALARLLAKRARSGGMCSPDGTRLWEINDDAMRYWLKICHAGGLLSSQNAYDYWLMNFVWSQSFLPNSPWGTLSGASERITRLLLLRWAWLHDAPMLAAIAWLVGRYGPCQPGTLVDRQNHYVEDALISVLAAARAASADIREQVEHRQLIAEIRGGFRYNTRRHKLMPHLALLVEAGVVSANDGQYQLSKELAAAGIASRPLDELVGEAMRPSALGFGGGLFLNLAQSIYDVAPQQVSDLTIHSWLELRAEIAPFWQQVLKWDRKFLGIDALAEFFIVRNLLRERPLWPSSAWRAFLEPRARYQPEELTVHVGRLGAVDYLRLTEDTLSPEAHAGAGTN